MTKQLGFEQRFGQGGAVHRHKRFAGAGRTAVDSARHQFLASARLTDHENRGRGGCHPGDQFVDIEHARALALDLRHLRSFSGRPRCGTRLGGKAPALQRARHGLAQFFDVEGLGDVVVGAVADGFHGAGDVAECGDEDDGRARGLFGKGTQHLHAAHSFHADVGDHQVIAPGCGPLDRGRAIVHRVDSKTFGTQDLAQEVARDGVVLDDQNSGHAAPPAATRGDAVSVWVVPLRGRRRVKAEPWPGVLSTAMVPPKALANSRQMAKPNPVPLPRPLVV